MAASSLPCIHRFRNASNKSKCLRRLIIIKTIVEETKYMHIKSCLRVSSSAIVVIISNNTDGKDDQMKPTAMLAEMKHNTIPGEGRYRVRVGMATCGISAGADVVHDTFVSSVKDAGLDNVDIIPTGCVGRCDLEPMAEVTRGNEPPVLYILLNEDKVRKIVEEHLAKGRVVEDYTV